MSRAQVQEQALTQKLSHYTAIAQVAALRVGRILNYDNVKILECHKAASAKWVPVMRTIPIAPQHDREIWFRNNDQQLAQEPLPHDAIGWCLRAFMANAAMETVLAHEVEPSMSRKAIGRIIRASHDFAYHAATGSTRPVHAPQVSPDTLIGHAIQMPRPNGPPNGRSYRYEVVDYTLSVLEGRQYVLKDQDGQLQRVLEEDVVAYADTRVKLPEYDLDLD